MLQVSSQERSGEHIFPSCWKNITRQLKENPYLSPRADLEPHGRSTQRQGFAPACYFLWLQGCVSASPSETSCIWCGRGNLPERMPLLVPLCLRQCGRLKQVLAHCDKCCFINESLLAWSNIRLLCVPSLLVCRLPERLEARYRAQPELVCVQWTGHEQLRNTTQSPS